MLRPLIRDTTVTDRPAFTLMHGPLLAHGDGPELVREDLVGWAAHHERLAARYRETDPHGFGAAFCRGKADAFREAAAALVRCSDFDVPRG